LGLNRLADSARVRAAVWPTNVSKRFCTRASGPTGFASCATTSRNNPPLTSKLASRGSSAQPQPQPFLVGFASMRFQPGCLAGRGGGPRAFRAVDQAREISPPRAHGHRLRSAVPGGAGLPCNAPLAKPTLRQCLRHGLATAWCSALLLQGRPRRWTLAQQRGSAGAGSGSQVRAAWPYRVWKRRSASATPLPGSKTLRFAMIRRGIPICNKIVEGKVCSARRSATFPHRGRLIPTASAFVLVARVNSGPRSGVRLCP